MARPLSCLLVTIQTEAGLARKVVDDNPFTVGRSLDAAIAFSDNNISRAHLLVKNKNGKVVVEDQNSANGTYINNEKIEPRRPYTIEQKDVVRLGNSKIELTFSVIEKTFGSKDIESADVPEEDRASLVDLIHGSHAEAQRLVKLGKDIHDNIIKIAEDRARTAEQTLAQEREAMLVKTREMAAQTLEQARINGAQIISAAEEDAKKSVASIHQRAAEIREQADEHRHAQATAAQNQVDEILRQGNLACEEMLETAKKSIQQITEAATKESSTLIDRSKQEAKVIVETASQEAIKLSDEAQKNYDEKIKDAITDADDLRARAKTQADASIQQAKTDAEGLVKDGEKEKDRLAQEGQKNAAVALENAIEQGEKKAAEFLEDAIAKGKDRAEEFLMQARKEAEIERDKMLSAAQAELQDLRHKKTTSEKEMNLALKKAKSDLDRLNKEIANQDDLVKQKRKIFEEELIHEREIKEKEAQALFDEKIKEIEIFKSDQLREIDKTKSQKLEEAEVFIREKNLELQKAKAKLDTQMESIKNKLAKIEPEYEAIEVKFNTKTKELQILEDKLTELNPKRASLQSEVDLLNHTKGELSQTIRELESKNGHLGLTKSSLEESLKSLQQEYDRKASEQKSLLNEELLRQRKDQESHLDKIRLEEMERIKQSRNDMIEQLVRDRQKISREIFNQVELEVVKFCKSSDWVEATPMIEQKINMALEEKSITMVTAQQTELASKTVSIRSRRRSEKWSAVLQGIVLGALMYYGGQEAYKRYESDFDPMKTAAVEKAKEVAADLERRKFDPPQDDELRDTYAGSVLYTRDYVTNYLNPDYQEKWLKACTTYLLKQWRIEEEKTISVMSSVNTLISTLQDKKQGIHPDYVKDGLKKMDEIEAETVAKLIEQLGGEVRYEAFRRFEKRHYTEYYLEREPAANSNDN